MRNNNDTLKGISKQVQSCARNECENAQPDGTDRNRLETTDLKGSDRRPIKPYGTAVLHPLN